MLSQAKTGNNKPQLLTQLERARVIFRPIPGSSEVQMACPNCGKDKHFYINIYKKVGFCQRCKEPYNYNRLCKVFKLTGTAGFEAIPAPSMLELKRAYQAILGNTQTLHDSKALPVCDLPLGAHPAYRYPIALKYLLGRGVSLRDIQKHEIRYCPYGPYYKRILFPVTWDNQLVGFNTRHVKSNAHPKYLTSRGFPSSRVLYPQDNLIMGRLVITEGAIPALWCQGVATFGKKFSQDQLKILIRNSKTVKQVVIAWDRDAWSSENPDKDPPGLQAWDRIKEFFPCAALILPETAPQPDHLSKSAFQAALENVWKKSNTRSGIYKVFEDGSIEAMN